MGILLKKRFRQRAIPATLLISSKNCIKEITLNKLYYRIYYFIDFNLYRLNRFTFKTLLRINKWLKRLK